MCASAAEQALHLRGAEHALLHPIAGVRLWGLVQSDGCRNCAGAHEQPSTPPSVYHARTASVRAALSRMQDVRVHRYSSCDSPRGSSSLIVGTGRAAPTPTARLTKGSKCSRADTSQEDRRVAAAAAAALRELPGAC
jgi:hypothetical protein